MCVRDNKQTPPAGPGKEQENLSLLRDVGTKTKTKNTSIMRN